MNQLVIAALQKCRVDSHHWLKALAGHSGRKCDCMLLGNAYIVITLWKAFMKLHHTRALPHRGGDADQPFVVLGHVAQPLAKHLGECLLRRQYGFLQAHRRVKLAGAVVSNRVHLSQLVALTFFRHHMQKLRAGAIEHQLLDVLQGGDQRVQIMPVNGANVVEAEVFKQRGGHHHAFGMGLEPLGQLKQGRRNTEYMLANAAR